LLDGHACNAGKPITPKLLASITEMIGQMNKGIATLQPLTQQR
jgi:hypothetical protein